ncbi:hypothetical protein ACF3MZ_23835 [Paenibacillaceae bacterium WGS1546]|uniref:hypothetical protein n=1 Tax=Cohnella sp. WGS1546 TaxID=3366810 RepID=UPI00372D26C3
MSQGEHDLSIIEKDLNAHLQRIKKIAQSNTIKNNDGLTVITKDDPIREESDWISSIKDYDNNQK